MATSEGSCGLVHEASCQGTNAGVTVSKRWHCYVATGETAARWHPSHLSRLARISTDRNSPNTRPSNRVLLGETQGQAVPPGDRGGFFEEIGIQDNGEMGSAVETDSDVPIG